MSAKVTAAEDAWASLWERAKEVGIPGVSPSDRARAHNLLTATLDESRTDAERAAFRSKLDKILEASTMSSGARHILYDAVDSHLISIGASTRLALAKGTCR